MGNSWSSTQARTATVVSVGAASVVGLALVAAWSRARPVGAPSLPASEPIEATGTAEPVEPERPEGDAGLTKPPAAELDLKQLLATGILAIKQSKLTEAVATLTQAADAFPDNDAAHYFLGTALLKKRQPLLASERFKTVLKMSPDSPDAALRLGDCCLSLHDLEGAQKSYEHALGLEPDNEQSLRAYAKCMLKMNKLERAVTALNRANELEPETVETLFALGNALALQGKFSEAAEQYLQTLKVNPRFRAAKVQLAELGRRKVQGQQFLSLNAAPIVMQYEQAIKSTIATQRAALGYDPVCLDSSYGHGMFSVLAARHGAESVRTLCNFRPDIAQQVFEDNDCTSAKAVKGDIKTYIRDDFAADILVLAFAGMDWIAGGVVSNVIHARQSGLLKPTGAVVPAGIALRAVVLHSHGLRDLNRSSTTCGFDVSAFNSFKHSQKFERLRLFADQEDTVAITQVHTITHLDMNTLRDNPAHVAWQVESLCDGNIDCVAWWFVPDFGAAGPLRSCSLAEAAEEWSEFGAQVVQFGSSCGVKKGDKLDFTVKLEGGVNVVLDEKQAASDSFVLPSDLLTSAWCDAFVAFQSSQQTPADVERLCSRFVDEMSTADSSATASMFDKALTSKTPSSLMELAAFAEKLRSRDLDMQATLMCVLAHTIASSVGIVDADLFNALTSCLQGIKAAEVPMWHFPMLNDEGRAVDYNKAICAAVDRLNKKQGASSLVLDVGAGSGLLTMMASRAGASKVIACEMMPLTCNVANKILVTNGIERSQAEVLSCKSTDLVTAGSETTDTASSANTLPCKAGALVSEIFEVGEVNRVNMQAFNAFAPNKKGVNLSVYDHTVLTAKPVKVTHINLKTDALEDSMFTKLAIDVAVAGRCDALICYFDIHLDEEICCSTAPSHGGANRNNAWSQMAHFPRKRADDVPVVLNVKAGDTVAMSGGYRDNNFWFSL